MAYFIKTVDAGTWVNWIDTSKCSNTWKLRFVWYLKCDRLQAWSCCVKPHWPMTKNHADIRTEPHLVYFFLNTRGSILPPRSILPRLCPAWRHNADACCPLIWYRTYLLISSRQWQPNQLNCNLTLKHRETHRCVVSTVATDTLVLKHQAISIHNDD